jgi:hypothetical protein
MARKRPEGKCRICGQYGPLSFEHIPPKAAFNDRPVVVAKFEDAIGLGPDEEVKGPIQQRGMGGYTLCERCNNNTGSWYGKRFVDWCYQGMDILIRSNGKPSLIYLNHLFPLAIIKQVVTMFFSVNGDGFRAANQELVRFVLNKERKYLSPKYRLFVYYSTTGRARRVGIAGVLSLGSGRNRISVVSEITYSPFGYVMTFNSEPPDERLFEITHFARYDYNEFVVMPLRLPVLPTHLAFPGDYRDRDEIYSEAGIQPPDGNKNRSA